MNAFLRFGVLLLSCAQAACALAGSLAATEELLVTRSEVGRPGGKLIIAERSEPKTLNPVTALDGPSRDVIRRMTADLIRINRSTQLTEPALAISWTASPDKRRYTLKLRSGVKFSDGHPFTADDVVFSFAVYLDPKVNSPQRDLLMIDERPIEVVKRDAVTVE